MLKGKKILVTGADGFIGGHLCNRLVKEQAVVHAIIHPSSQNFLFEKDWVHSYPIDICNHDEFSAIVRKISPQIIFHCAGMTNPSRDKKLLNETFRVNFSATKNLLESLENPEKIVFLSTAELYQGNPTPYKENMPVLPSSPYSASKAAAENILMLYSRAYNFPVTIMRLFLVYGPGQGLNRFMPQLINSALNNSEFPMTLGEQKREFTFIDDVIEAMILCSISQESNSEIINIGTGEEIPLKELAELVKEIIESTMQIKLGAVPYRENEIWNFSADITKAKSLLNWKPKNNLREGIVRTIEWYRKNT